MTKLKDIKIIDSKGVHHLYFGAMVVTDGPFISIYNIYEDDDTVNILAIFNQPSSVVLLPRGEGEEEWGPL